MENNQVKVNAVYRTNDYSLFSKLDGNRNVNKAHLNRLKKSILFSFAQKLGYCWCYQCATEIKDIDFV